MSVRTLADLIRGPALSIDIAEGVDKALQVMGEKRISCVLVRSAGQMVGIVTEKDVVRSYTGVNSGRLLGLGDIMTPSPMTVPASMEHLEAYRLMVERRFRHLPVHDDDGEIIGIVTESDYVRTLGSDYYIRLKDVASVMAPVTVLPSWATLGRALEILSRSDISCVVIGDGEGTLGLLTERDVVRLLRDGTVPESTRVDQVMTAPIITVRRDATLLDASTILAEKRIRRVVVVDEADNAVGILGQHEIVKGLENEYIGHLEGVIEEKNKALSELSETRVNLQEKSRLLQQTVDELSATHAELREFTKIASHDLQEPLRRIGTYAQLLERHMGQGLDEEGQSYLRFVTDSASRAQQLMKDLVLYAGKSDLVRDLEPVDLGEALSVALDMLRSEVEASGAEIVADKLPKLMAHRESIIEILVCLIGNAIKFHHPGRAPKIAVTASQTASKQQITIADNGIGIDNRFLEQIFGLFERLHSREDYPGNGVGLSICRRLIDQLEGRIWAESEQGQGSRFLFTLPRRRKIH